MRVMLTGGNGMVGRNMLAHPSAKMLEIIAPPRAELDLSVEADVKRFLQDLQPDVVIHAAGKVGGIKANMADPVGFYLHNLQIGNNVLLAARDAGVKKVINLGSTCMYPRHAQNPLVETSILTGELEPTNEGYAISKFLSIKICNIISKKPGYNYKTLVPTNLYGPNDNYDLEKSHLLAAIIKKLSDAKKIKKKYVEIWGDGKARREFMFVSDLSDAILFSLKNFEKIPSILNIGTGIDYTIENYYKKAAKIIYPNAKYYFNKKKPSGMRRKLLDVSISKKLGWKAKISLSEGIKKTYKEYKKKYEN